MSILRKNDSDEHGQVRGWEAVERYAQEERGGAGASEVGAVQVRSHDGSNGEAEESPLRGKTLGQVDFNDRPQVHEKNGEPGGTRTRDHRIKSAFTASVDTPSGNNLTETSGFISTDDHPELAIRGKTRGKTDQPSLLDGIPAIEIKSLPHYDGPVYDPARDQERLAHQTERIKTLMLDGKWRTLAAIAAATGDPAASVSAQLRHLRKPRFGSYEVSRRYIGNGLYEYRVSERVELAA